MSGRRVPAPPPPSVAIPRREFSGKLVDEAIADLRYLEPTRTRNRLIEILENLGARLARLEHLHQEQIEGA